MKKFFALALALALTMALAVTCFAAKDINAVGGSKSETVKVGYIEGGKSATVYGVDVSFEAMTFNYTAASQGTWDPDTHTYKDIDAAEWDKTEAKVTVTNHSNAAIVATVSYAKGDYTGNVKVDIVNATLNIGSAVETAVGDAPQGVATVKVSGDAAKGESVIGTVTVTIAAAQ